jgi:L-ascorbate metabolism protein UlaG (beta-lactamase superfamily)
MKITWFGQACFELVTDAGTVIICDPYHPFTGYAAHPRTADVVTISHEHGDHNFTGWILGTPEIIRGTGVVEVKDVRITGLPSFHDGNGGNERGLNTVFIIEADGITLCHMGDIGHEPDEELYLTIGRPDVLFIPVGGFYTVEPALAVSIAKRIGARLTIPMHFKTGVKDMPIDTVELFANETGANRLDNSTITFTGDTKAPGTVVLDFLRDETGE